MNKYIESLRRSRFATYVANKIVALADSRFGKVVATLAIVFGFGLLGQAQGGTDATVIATNAQTAFGIIAPITITIAGFYVILTIAKRVAH